MLFIPACNRKDAQLVKRLATEYQSMEGSILIYILLSCIFLLCTHKYIHNTIWNSILIRNLRIHLVVANGPILSGLADVIAPLPLALTFIKQSVPVIKCTPAAHSLLVGTLMGRLESSFLCCTHWNENDFKNAWPWLDHNFHFAESLNDPIWSTVNLK